MLNNIPKTESLLTDPTEAARQSVLRKIRVLRAEHCTPIPQDGMPTAPGRPPFKIAIGKDGSLKLQADKSSTSQELQVIDTKIGSRQAALISILYDFVHSNKKFIICCIAGVTVYCYLIAPPMAWATDSVYTTKVMAETQKAVAETQKMVVEKQRGSSSFWICAALAAACAFTSAGRRFARAVSRKLEIW